MGKGVFAGTELKLNIHIEPIGDITMDDYNFVAEFFCYANKKIAISKPSMKRIDENNYIAIIKTNELGAGMLRCIVNAQVPDSDCEDGYRTEIVAINTEIIIVKTI